MKYFQLTALIILSLIIVSCSGTRVVPQDEYYLTTGFDFSEYTAKGFHITPERYLGSYESIGVIRIQYIPEFIREDGISEGLSREELENNYVRYADQTRNLVYWHVKRVPTKDLIREAYEVASEMGADAITHFEMTSDSYKNGGLTVQSAVLTGFAIKRLD